MTKYTDTPPNELREKARPNARQRIYYSLEWRTGTELVNQDEEPVVYVRDGVTREPQPLPIYYKHGSGHSWGYSGSGPSQLALDLLLDVLGEWPTRKEMDKGNTLAWMLHHHFKDEVLARLPQDEPWQFPGSLIVAWVIDWVHRHPAQYNDWVVNHELDKALARLAPFEAKAEDQIELTTVEQGEWRELNEYVDRLYHLAQSETLLEEFAREHNYAPFNDPSYV